LLISLESESVLSSFIERLCGGNIPSISQA
jgi:hypothetical protein